MRAAKVDGNHSDIVNVLRKAGCSVQSLAGVGKGVPDIIVGYLGVNYLFEIKYKKGKLTEDQGPWHKKWFGQVSVVRTLEEALSVIGIKRMSVR